jgi:hypothetical protein
MGLTRVETKPLNPPAGHLAHISAAHDRLAPKLFPQLCAFSVCACADVRELLVPSACMDVHKVHATGICDFNGSDSAQEERGKERGNEGDMGGLCVDIRFAGSNLEDLGPCESFIGSTPSQVGQLLGTPNCFFNNAALFGGTRVLPNWCVGDREGFRR